MSRRRLNRSQRIQRSNSGPNQSASDELASYLSSYELNQFAENLPSMQFDGQLRLERDPMDGKINASASFSPVRGHTDRSSLLPERDVPTQDQEHPVRLAARRRTSDRPDVAPSRLGVSSISALDNTARSVRFPRSLHMAQSPPVHDSSRDGRPPLHTTLNTSTHSHGPTDMLFADEMDTAGDAKQSIAYEFDSSRINSSRSASASLGPGDRSGLFGTPGKMSPYSRMRQYMSDTERKGEITTHFADPSFAGSNSTVYNTHGERAEGVVTLGGADRLDRLNDSAVMKSISGSKYRSNSPDVSVSTPLNINDDYAAPSPLPTPIKLPLDINFVTRGSVGADLAVLQSSSEESSDSSDEEKELPISHQIVFSRENRFRELKRSYDDGLALGGMARATQLLPANTPRLFQSNDRDRHQLPAPKLLAAEESSEDDVLLNKARNANRKLKKKKKRKTKKKKKKRHGSTSSTSSKKFLSYSDADSSSSSSHSPSPSGSSSSSSSSASSSSSGSDLDTDDSRVLHSRRRVRKERQRKHKHKHKRKHKHRRKHKEKASEDDDDVLDGSAQHTHSTSSSSSSSQSQPRDNLSFYRPSMPVRHQSRANRSSHGLFMTDALAEVRPVRKSNSVVAPHQARASVPSLLARGGSRPSASVFSHGVFKHPTKARELVQQLKGIGGGRVDKKEPEQQPEQDDAGSASKFQSFKQWSEDAREAKRQEKKDKKAAKQELAKEKRRQKREHVMAIQAQVAQAAARLQDSPMKKMLDSQRKGLKPVELSAEEKQMHESAVELRAVAELAEAAALAAREEKEVEDEEEPTVAEMQAEIAVEKDIRASVPDSRPLGPLTAVLGAEDVSASSSTASSVSTSASTSPTSAYQDLLQFRSKSKQFDQKYAHAMQRPGPQSLSFMRQERGKLKQFLVDMIDQSKSSLNQSIQDQHDLIDRAQDRREKQLLLRQKGLTDLKQQSFASSMDLSHISTSSIPTNFLYNDTPARAHIGGNASAIAVSDTTTDSKGQPSSPALRELNDIITSNHSPLTTLNRLIAFGETRGTPMATPAPRGQKTLKEKMADLESDTKRVSGGGPIESSATKEIRSLLQDKEFVAWDAKMGAARHPSAILESSATTPAASGGNNAAAGQKEESLQDIIARWSTPQAKQPTAAEIDRILTVGMTPRLDGKDALFPLRQLQAALGGVGVDDDSKEGGAVANGDSFKTPMSLRQRLQEMPTPDSDASGDSPSLADIAGMSLEQLVASARKERKRQMELRKKLIEANYQSLSVLRTPAAVAEEPKKEEVAGQAAAASAATDEENAKQL